MAKLSTNDTVVTLFLLPDFLLILPWISARIILYDVILSEPDCCTNILILSY